MILLDTCTLLWVALEPSRIPHGTRRQIVSRGTPLFSSSISALEIGFSVRRKRLELPFPPDVWYKAVLEHHGISEIPVTGDLAARSTMLPPLHADPVDRILIATAQIHGLTLLTPDKTIAGYPDVRTLWGATQNS